MIKAVLFDIDNTLLDFDAYVKDAMKDGFDFFGLGRYNESMYEIFEKINSGMWKKLEKGEITFEELQRDRWNNVFLALGISFDGLTFEKHFRKFLFNSGIKVEGAEDIVEYLKDKYVLCVASNGPYEQQINRLKVAGLHRYFSGFFISEKIGASKPSEAFFSYCLEEINRERIMEGESEVLPSEVMMIGDSFTSDIAGAVNFGMKTCYFDRNGKGNTSGLPIDHIVKKLEDIKSFL